MAFAVLLLLFLALICVLLYRANCLAVAVKGGLGGLGVFLSSPPGLEAGLFAVLIGGAFVGPLVMIVCGLGFVAYTRVKRHQPPAA